MSLRPVDMQIVMPRAVEGQRTGPDQARPDLQTQHFAQQLQKKVEAQTQQVVETNKSEKGAVDKDGKNQNGGKDAKKRNTENLKKEEQSKKANKPAKEGMFDISI